jgi:hypothetical protein
LPGVVRKGFQRVTAIAYTAKRDFSRGVLGFLSDRDLFYDTYVFFYGVSRERIYTRFRTVYLSTPYARGYVFKYGSVLTYTPITFYLNLESKCFDRKIVEEVFEDINSGFYSLYLSTPFTSDNMRKLYNDKVYRLLKEVGLGLDLLYPSYSVVIGKSRVFKDSPYTLWSSEILAAVFIEIAVGRDRVRVVNSRCIDVPDLRPEVEKLFIERLALDFIAMLLDKKIIDEKKAMEYLEMVKS